MTNQAEKQDDRELSFRLLRHYAHTVSRRKYHGLDAVIAKVEGRRRTAA